MKNLYDNKLSMLNINSIIPTKLNSIYSHKIKNPFNLLDKSKYLIFVLNFNTKVLIENCLPPTFTTNAIVEFYTEMLI